MFAEIYLRLMKDGWTLPEIDRMDLCYFLRLMGHRLKGEAAGLPQREEPQTGDRGLYIDQFGLF